LKRFDASCFVLPAEETLGVASGGCGSKERAFYPIVVVGPARGSLNRLAGLSLRLLGFGQEQMM